MKFLKDLLGITAVQELETELFSKEQQLIRAELKVKALQSKNTKQTAEIRRLLEVNAARKNVISKYAKMRDELKDYILYTTAVLDAYGHKDRSTMGFDLRSAFTAPTLKEAIDEVLENISPHKVRSLS